MVWTIDICQSLFLVTTVFVQWFMSEAVTGQARKLCVSQTVGTAGLSSPILSCMAVVRSKPPDLELIETSVMS